MLDSTLQRIIQEVVPGRQVTIAHIIAHPDDDLSKKIGIPGAEALGVLTLTPREAAIIAGDYATKAAEVKLGFLDRFTGALVVHGSVSAVEESLIKTVKSMENLGFTPCRITKA